jgi:Cyclophilin type peptidyl-prolyl cis-trans isomerase/CLD
MEGPGGQSELEQAAMAGGCTGFGGGGDAQRDLHVKAVSEKEPPKARSANPSVALTFEYRLKGRAAGETSRGRVVFRLYKDVCPKLSEEFRGAVEAGAFTGGKLGQLKPRAVAINPREFTDWDPRDADDREVHFTRPGLLVSDQPNKRILITTDPDPRADEEPDLVVFGSVLSGYDTIFELRFAVLDDISVVESEVLETPAEEPGRHNPTDRTRWTQFPEDSAMDGPSMMCVAAYISETLKRGDETTQQAAVDLELAARYAAAAAKVAPEAEADDNEAGGDGRTLSAKAALELASNLSERAQTLRIQLEQYPEALVNGLYLLGCDERDAKALARCATCWRNLANVEKAEWLVNKALRSDPDEPLAIAENESIAGLREKQQGDEKSMAQRMLGLG